MKNTSPPESDQAVSDDLLPEYNLDYSKGRPNRYAGKIDKSQVVVMLEPDIAEVFTTPESVNAVLRADFDHACDAGETCSQVILSAGSTTTNGLTERQRLDHVPTMMAAYFSHEPATQPKR